MRDGEEHPGGAIVFSDLPQPHHARLEPCAGGTSYACDGGGGLRREERLNWGHTSLGSSLGILTTVYFVRATAASLVNGGTWSVKINGDKDGAVRTAGLVGSRQ